MAPWVFEPNNADPSGEKAEFRNLPKCREHRAHLHRLGGSRADPAARRERGQRHARVEPRLAERADRHERRVSLQRRTGGRALSAVRREVRGDTMKRMREYRSWRAVRGAIALAVLFGCDESVFIGDQAPNPADGAAHGRPSRGGHDELPDQVQLDGKRQRRHGATTTSSPCATGTRAASIPPIRPGSTRGRRSAAPTASSRSPPPRRRGRAGRQHQVLLVLPEGSHVLRQGGGRQGGAIGAGLPVVHGEHAVPLRRHRDSRGTRPRAASNRCRRSSNSRGGGRTRSTIRGTCRNRNRSAISSRPPRSNIVDDLNSHPERFEEPLVSVDPVSRPGRFRNRDRHRRRRDGREQGFGYVFAVQAKDEAGAVTSVFDPTPEREDLRCLRVARVRCSG